MFILVIGGSAVSSIPGISIAGSRPEVVPFTAPADADVLLWGKPHVVDALPIDPDGHPTPALITRAAYLAAGFPALIVRAGTFVPPAVPFVETGAGAGGNPVSEDSLPDAESLFRKAATLGRELSKTHDTIVIGESIPGGTTTALFLLRSLGYDGMVSSASPSNPVRLKEDMWAQVKKRLHIDHGSWKGKGMLAVSSLGDPMQVVAAGIASGCSRDTRVVLAGGTQMLAAAALLRNLGEQRPLLVATTRYIMEDTSADFQSIASQVGVEVYSACLDFSRSPFPGLADYEKGFVKEGVGAGGAVWYAGERGVPVSRVISGTESLYRDLVTAVGKTS